MPIKKYVKKILVVTLKELCHSMGKGSSTHHVPIMPLHVRATISAIKPCLVFISSFQTNHAHQKTPTKPTSTDNC